MSSFNNSEYSILVVDDEVDLCDLFAEELQERGFKVFTAYGGDQAFNVINDNNISAILSDIKMPEGDGLDLLSKVKEKYGDILIMLMMTGYADISEDDLINMGAKALYNKPLDIDEFIDDLEKILSKDEAA